MANSRQVAVEKAFEQKPVTAEPPAPSTSQYYGCMVFNRKNMRKYLTADVRRAIYESIEQGKTLDLAFADQVA